MKLPDITFYIIDTDKEGTIKQYKGAADTLKGEERDYQRS